VSARPLTRIGLRTPRFDPDQECPMRGAALDDSGCPPIIRPSFTMGRPRRRIATQGRVKRDSRARIDAPPPTQVLIEESVRREEFEMEVVRDKKDNCIIIARSRTSIDGRAHGDSIRAPAADS